MRPTICLLIALALVLTGFGAVCEQSASIRIDLPTDTLYIGQVLSAGIVFTSEDASGILSWSSTNPVCADVDENGVITAKAYGSTYIKAQCGRYTASAKVTVFKAPTVLTLSESCVCLEKGQTLPLGVSFNRDALAPVSFASLSPEVASVDENGVITALATGSALITAETPGGLRQCCLVNVPGSELPDPVDFEVVFMDIDSNDGILLRCGEEYAFIDSGSHNYGVQAVEFMQARGITHLKYYIGSHAHLDHIGGACVVLDRMEVDCVIVPHPLVESAIKSSAWTEEEKAAARSANYIRISHGEAFYLGNIPFLCLGPVKVRSVDTKDVNENGNSLVLRVDAGQVSLLLTGDATNLEINEIRKVYGEKLCTDVFKNPHHAAELNDETIRFLSPRIAVFSTSSLRLPSRRYLDVLEGVGCVCYTTATRWHSDVTLYTDGTEIRVTTVFEDNREAWALENKA